MILDIPGTLLLQKHAFRVTLLVKPAETVVLKVIVSCVLPVLTAILSPGSLRLNALQKSLVVHKAPLSTQRSDVEPALKTAKFALQRLIAYDVTVYPTRLSYRMRSASASVKSARLLSTTMTTVSASIVSFLVPPVRTETLIFV